MQIDLERETLSAGGETLGKGDVVTIDGSTGQIIKGRVPTREPKLSSDFLTLMGWADQFRRMKVRANADTPADARQSLAFGADGIGLCRTEHMFFEEGRIVPMREMILADDTEGRRAALAKLLPMQRKDFIELFEIMAGAPVTIRLLDPPLARISAPWRGRHRRSGGGHGGERRAAEAQGRGFERIQSHARPSRLPPPGKLPGDRRDAGASHLRGSHRSRPQARGERRAGNHGAARHRQGRARPRQGAHRRRGARGGNRARGQARLFGRHHGRASRACINAGEIGKSADFFSFGTNDLTQTTFGLSRDDAGRFLGEYTEKGIIQHDPFVTLDPAVGELMWMAVERGRRSHPDLKIGICGEHGGDPETIRFCEDIRLDYVSCSPYRVPVARLAAAQAALSLVVKPR